MLGLKCLPPADHRPADLPGRSRGCGLAGAEALILAEMPPLRTAHRPRGEGGQPAAEIGIAEWLARNLQTLKPGQNAAQSCFRFHAAENEMRMSFRIRKQKACRLNARMAGLNRLIDRRQIAPHESVEINVAGMIRRDLLESTRLHR